MEKKMKKIANYLVVLAALLFSNAAWAADGAVASLAPLGAGIGVGLAVIGAGFGIGKVGNAALEAISRNPSAAGKLFLPYILGFVLIEGVAIFGLVIALGLK